MKKITLTNLFLAGCVALGAQTYNAVTTFAGNGFQGLVDGPVASAEFYHPYGVCMDPATGVLYVADGLDNCIRKIENGTVSTFAGNGTQGDVDANGTNARFYGPSGVCFKNGYLYITDNGNHKIKKIDASGNVSTVAGTGVAGSVDGAVTSAKFNNPVDVDVTANGDIYVADYGNNKIRKISGGIVTTIAGSSQGDADGPASSAQFYRTRSVTVAPNGNVYICDMVNGKIKMLDVSNNMVTTIAGSGVSGETDGTGSAASFTYPAGMDWDLYGNLIVVDETGVKVRRVTTSGVVTTIAGTGTAGSTDGNVMSASFDDLAGMCVGPDGSIYVGDRNNNKIRKISVADVGYPEYNTLPISVFPNPVSENLTISNSGFSTISIFDAAGKLCRSIEVADKNPDIIISVTDLAMGEYTIIATSEDKKYTSKFIRE